MERYISSYPGAVVMTSHDRTFLDNLVTRITELDFETLSDYPCDYSQYLERREKRRQELIKQAEEQEKERERIQRFINKFRADKRRATMVQSRIKRLEKMDRVVVPSVRKRVHLRFPDPPRSGNEVLTVEDLGKCYGSNRVFSGASFMVRRGDRVALVGENGAGKSTLMRLLNGSEEPTEGKVRLGHGVIPLYFAQDQGVRLPRDQTVHDVVQEGCDEGWRLSIRNLLGAFLFSGDDVFKLCKVLSGGEKSRVGLARIISRTGNLLLLDEPTNHLDIQTKEILLEALGKYRGTIVFVSHDRYFIEHLATRIIELQSGEVTCYEWGYRDYLWWKEEMEED
jgi:ATP-binding cassette subfamily F protein 3